MMSAKSKKGNSDSGEGSVSEVTDTSDNIVSVVSFQNLLLEKSFLHSF